VHSIWSKTPKDFQPKEIWSLGKKQKYIRKIQEMNIKEGSLDPKMGRILSICP